MSRRGLSERDLRRIVVELAGSRDLLSAALTGEPQGADERYFCRDLPDLDEAALLRERQALRLAQVLGERMTVWGEKRLKLIEAELRRRKPRLELVPRKAVRHAS